jgi:hypothetical protein
VRIEHLEDPLGGRHGLLEVRVYPAEFLERRVHHERREDERREIPLRPLITRDLTAAVPDQPDDREPAKELHQRRQHGHGARDLQVRAVEPLRRRGKTSLLVPLGAKGLDDPMSRERFAGDVRQPLELFLTPARRSPHALPQPDERVNHNRRARDAQERQPPVVVEQQRRIADERQALANQVPDRFRDRMLNLVDVVRDARHQLTAGAAAEESGGLVEDVPEQLVADVAHDLLTDVGHEVGRTVRGESFEEVRDENERRPEAEILSRREHAIDDRRNLQGDAGGGRGIDDHRDEGRNEPPAIRAGIREQARERVHSVNRYFKSTHSATMPSRQVIFFPSSYPRPS